MDDGVSCCRVPAAIRLALASAVRIINYHRYTIRQAVPINEGYVYRLCPALAPILLFPTSLRGRECSETAQDQSFIVYLCVCYKVT